MNEDTNHKNHKVLKFAQEHTMGVLSTVDEGGTPWGAAIYCLADEDLNFYFVTRTETYKYKNLQNNPKVSLTIADPETQTTIQLSGEVSRMPIQKYMDIFFDKFAALKPHDDDQWAPPVDRIHEGNYMPLMITPTKLQYADYGKDRVDVHGDYIENIIP